jgi:hypothetical protein
MMHDPLIRYHLAKAQQRDVWQEAELDRQAKEATTDQSGLVERVLQNVWKRLALPAREAVSRPLPAPSGGLPALPEQGPIMRERC